MVKDSIAIPVSAISRHKRASGEALGISEELLPASSQAESAKLTDADRRDAVLVDRYQLQADAAQLMPHEAVAKCHFSMIGSTAKLLYIPASDTAAFANFETCHSVWMCAVCSARISFERQAELNQAIKAAHALGYVVAMCTYTFAHYQGDDLDANLNAMLAARRAMLSGRAAVTLKKKYTTVGCIRCLETTHGKNGHHPHIHELVFFDVSDERERAQKYAEYAELGCEFGQAHVVRGLYERVLHQAIAEKIASYGVELGARWKDVAAKQGLSMNGHGFQIDSADARVANYIAKFGKEPGEKTRQAWSSGDWNEAAEMTQWHRKRGTNEHYTPFDLLRFSEHGDEEAGKLFQVYARAFKGRLQIYFPGPLRKLLGMSAKSKTDEEIIEEHEQDKEEVAAISSKLFYEHIRQKKGARPKILNEVRRARGDVAPVAEYMALNFDAVLDASEGGLPVFKHIDDMPYAMAS